jgi:murein DD-endopeptidase MepM/ murein hydrolase activator NlpD
MALLSVTIFAQTPAEKVQKMADLIMAAYNAQDYAQVEQQFNPQMRAAVPGDKLKEFLDGCHRDYGKIVKLGAPNFLSASAAVFPADFEKTKMDLLVALDGEGRISGLRISPPKTAVAKNTARNKTALRLPFNGEWFVFWGGDTREQNYHVDAATQRFAFDILKVDAEGKTHRGEGKVNEDYYAFGQEIVADADGTVTDVVTGIKDNVPGVMNPLMAVGNFVMIRHANGEVSVFCHLKYESTRVKVGQRVKQGETIGLCGNSGNSSEAHLHYQVQGTTLFEAENSMKVFFEKIMVRRGVSKTAAKAEYSPVQGDIVSQN